MADVNPAPDPTETPTPAQTAPVDQQQAVPGTWEDVFKHPRFTELIGQKNTLQSQLDAMKAELEQFSTERKTAETEQQKKEREALKKREEWQQLATENEARAEKAEADLKTAEKQLKQYEDLLKPDIEARLSGLPETVAPLVKPVLDGMDLLGQLKYFVENSDSIKAATSAPAPTNGETTTPPSGVPPTPPADSQDSLLGEKAAEARQAIKQQVRTFL